MIARSVFIFALAGIGGPMLRWLTWPPGPSSAGAISDLIYDLVLLIWPTQPLASIEISAGTNLAILFAVLANIAVFGLLGLLAGALAKTAIQLSSAYLAVCVMIIVMAVWSIGLGFSHVDMIALVVALALYAVPFALVWQFSRSKRLA